MVIVSQPDHLPSFIFHCVDCRLSRVVQLQNNDTVIGLGYGTVLIDYGCDWILESELEYRHYTWNDYGAMLTRKRNGNLFAKNWLAHLVLPLCHIALRLNRKLISLASPTNITKQIRTNDKANLRFIDSHVSYTCHNVRSTSSGQEYTFIYTVLVGRFRITALLLLFF